MTVTLNSQDPIPSKFVRARIPAYELATSHAARRAIDSIVCCESPWRDYSDLSDQAALTLAVILRLYADDGQAPPRGKVANSLGVDGRILERHLAELVSQDLVVLDGSGEPIGAYPFVDHPMGHEVHFSTTGQVVSAMCAVDALGAGAMVNKDTEIHSRCAWCSAPIAILTAHRGKRVAALTPEGAVVQIKKVHALGIAAHSLCRGILFYCSVSHAEFGRDVDFAGVDHLSVFEALEVGRALFEQRALFNCSS